MLCRSKKSTLLGLKFHLLSLIGRQLAFYFPLEKNFLSRNASVFSFRLVLSNDILPKYVDILLLQLENTNAKICRVQEGFTQGVAVKCVVKFLARAYYV
jgi:hypothetical protein